MLIKYKNEDSKANNQIFNVREDDNYPNHYLIDDGKSHVGGGTLLKKYCTLHELIKASTAVMSHLSDTQEEIGFCMNEQANVRINFTKFIILRCDGDLNKEIDADALYTEFLNQ